MKKMKKFLAMLLAMAMVLGMSIASFAEPNSAKITVSNIATPGTNNAGSKIDAAKVEYVQVIKQAPIGNGNTTGWDFVDKDYALAYIKAYTDKTEYSAENAQAAIQALINDEGSDGYTKSATKADEAISGVSNVVVLSSWKTGGENVSDGTAEWTVTEPGLYIVKITQTGFNYKSMAAYVAFNQVIQNADGTYTYPSMEDAELVAKGSDDSQRTTKTSNDADNVVAVGDPIEYTIETIVPFVQMDNLVDLGQYVVKDTLTGADFDITTVSAKYKDDDNSTITFEDSDVSLDTGTNTLTVNLTSQLGSVDDENANANANRTIVITYTATVNSVDSVTNTAETGHEKDGSFSPVYGSGHVDTFTGSVTITKFNENETVQLPGAGFEVRKDNGIDPLTFTEVKEGDNVAYYKYDSEGSVTIIKTGADGTATIKGLDIGDYHFKEVVAPNGYSINAELATGSVKLGAGKTAATVAADLVFTNAKMTDTTLTSLPSTGGIGTTIFTVGGCAIMIIAAGLYFSLRRRTVN